MEYFELKKGEEYIELNNLLKVMGWVITGGEAKEAISNGLVKVNNAIELRKRNKIRSGDQVEFDGEKVEVK